MIRDHYGGEKGFWNFLKSRKNDNCLMGCSIKGNGKEGPQVVDGTPTGLILNHAYSILGIFEVEDPKDKARPIRLLSLMNPWGQGEWTGKFADEDEAWDDHKGLKEKLNYVFKNDGNWWMRYDDFCAHFNKLYLCKIFPSTWS